MRRRGNILDPIQKELDQKVFNGIDPRPRIIKFITEEMQKVLYPLLGFDPLEFIDLYFTGSLTTYQYSHTSDADISVFVQWDQWPTGEEPKMIRRSLIPVIMYKLDGTNLPGTQHPIQHFIVPPGTRPEDLYKPGLRSAWSFRDGKWLVPPEKDRVHDISIELPVLYHRAEMMADKMEELLDYNPVYAKEFWHQIHRKRQRDQQHGLGDFSEGNIVYKYLLANGYFDRIRDELGEKIAKVADNFDYFEPQVGQIWTLTNPFAGATPGTRHQPKKQTIEIQDVDEHHVWYKDVDTQVGLDSADGMSLNRWHNLVQRGILIPRPAQWELQQSPEEAADLWPDTLPENWSAVTDEYADEPKCPHCGSGALTRTPNGSWMCLDCYWQEGETLPSGDTILPENWSKVALTLAEPASDGYFLDNRGGMHERSSVPLDRVVFNVYDDNGVVVGSAYGAVENEPRRGAPGPFFGTREEGQPVLNLASVFVKPKFRNTDAFAQLIGALQGTGHPIYAFDPKNQRLLELMIRRYQSNWSMVREADTQRLFLAYELPPEIVQQVIQWQQENMPEGVHPEPDTNLHMTIAFLGDTDTSLIPGLQQILAEIDPSKIVLTGPIEYRELEKLAFLALQDNGGNEVVEQINEKLNALMGYEPQFKPWLPHITVWRFAPQDKPNLQPQLPNFGSFTPLAVHVYTSVKNPAGGGIYQKVAWTPVVIEGEGIPEFAQGESVRHRTDPYRAHGYVGPLNEDGLYPVQWYPMDSDMEYHKPEDLVSLHNKPMPKLVSRTAAERIMYHVSPENHHEQTGFDNRGVYLMDNIDEAISFGNGWLEKSPAKHLYEVHVTNPDYLSPDEEWEALEEEANPHAQWHPGDIPPEDVRLLDTKVRPDYWKPEDFERLTGQTFAKTADDLSWVDKSTPYGTPDGGFIGGPDHPGDDPIQAPHADQEVTPQGRLKVIYDFDRDQIILGDIKKSEQFPPGQIIGDYDHTDVYLNDHSTAWFNPSYFRRLWEHSFPKRQIRRVILDKGDGNHEVVHHNPQSAILSTHGKEDHSEEELEPNSRQESSQEAQGSLQEAQEHVASGEDYSWPEWDDVDFLSQEAVENHQGYRDPDAVMGAVGNAQMAHHYGQHQDIFHTAADILYKIQRQQAVVDGNKRTGAAVALNFLEENGIETDPLIPHYEELATLINSLDRGSTVEELAEFLRRYLS